jgi:hypothetical protein
MRREIEYREKECVLEERNNTSEYLLGEFEIVNALNRYPLFDEDGYITHNGEDRIKKHMCWISSLNKYTYFRVIIKRRKYDNIS